MWQSLFGFVGWVIPIVKICWCSFLLTEQKELLFCTATGRGVSNLCYPFLCRQKGSNFQTPKSSSMENLWNELCPGVGNPDWNSLFSVPQHPTSHATCFSGLLGSLLPHEIVERLCKCRTIATLMTDRMTATRWLFLTRTGILGVAHLQGNTTGQWK